MRPERRVFLLNRYFFPDQSATAQLLTDLAEALEPCGKVIVLCSRQLLEDPRPDLPRRGRLGNVHIHRLWSTAWGRRGLVGRACDYVSFLFSVAIILFLRLRRGDIVIAKTDPPLLGVVAVLVTLGRRSRVVHWLQDLYPETAWRLGLAGESSLVGRSFRALRDWSLRRGSLTVAISRGMQAYLAREAGVHSAIVIPNWSDDMRCSGYSNYRHQLGLRDEFVIGYSGNFGRAHPLDAVLGLARQLRGTADIHFLFTGGGVHHELLRAHVERDNLRNCTFLPYQPRDRLPQLLAAADMHLILLDPRVENFIFPSKLYGILSAGRPVLHLGDPCGELGRLIRELDCGWSLAAERALDNAALLLQLRHEAQELRRRGDNGRRAFEEHFSKAAALARWHAALAPLTSIPA